MTLFGPSKMATVKKRKVDEKEWIYSVSSSVDDLKLLWNKVTGIITDGAPAMAGEQRGL